MSVSLSKDNILSGKHFQKDSKYARLKLAMTSFMEFTNSSANTADSSTKTVSSYTTHSKDSCQEENRILAEGINLINLSPSAKNSRQFNFGNDDIQKALSEENKSKLTFIVFDL